MLAFKEWSFYSLFFLSIFIFWNAFNNSEFQEKVKRYLRVFCSLYIVFLLIGFTYCASCNELIKIQSIFGENWNFLASTTLILLPLCLIRRTSILTFLYNLFFWFSSFVIVYLSSSLSVLIIYFVVLFCHYLKLQKLYLFFIIGLVLLILFIGFSDQLEHYFKLFNFHSRYYFIDSSFKLLSNNPIGFGFGSWKHNVFQFDLSEVARLNYSYFFPNPNSHSLTTKLMVECGVFGIISYLVILCYSGKKVLDKELTFFGRNALSSIFVLLSLSEVFASLLYHNSRYIGSYLLIAILIAYLIPNNLKNMEAKYDVSKILCAIIIFIILLFNTNYAIKRNAIYRNTTKLSFGLHKLKDSNLIEDLLINKGVSEIDNISLPFSLAKHNSFISSNKLQTIKYFEFALSISPYSRNILYHYALFEYDNGNYIKSYSLAKKAFLIQNTNGFLNALLVDTCIENGDLINASYYLEHLEESTKMYAGRSFKKRYSDLSNKLSIINKSNSLND